MDRPYREISWSQFQKRFRTEAACRRYLFKLRWPKGFVCPQCGHTQYYRVPKRELFQCKQCSHQTSVTAGTVLHKTRTSLKIWFWAIYLMANDKRGLSALQLSKKLGVSYYVAWTMLHKIRKAMRDRDSVYHPDEAIDVSGLFLGRGPGGDKGGRGAKKTPIAMRISAREGGVRLASMSVLSEVAQDVSESGRDAKQVADDESQEGSDARIRGESRNTARSPKSGRFDRSEVSKDLVGWARIVASNAKAFLLGTFHGIGQKHLQKYLDEFCYRFNRRHQEPELFDRLVTACVNSSGLSYYELTQYPIREGLYRTCNET